MTKQAMYLKRDGSIRIEPPYSDGASASRSVRKPVLRNWFSLDVGKNVPTKGPEVEEESYMLVYTSNHYYIYEEI